MALRRTSSRSLLAGLCVCLIGSSAFARPGFEVAALLSAPVGRPELSLLDVDLEGEEDWAEDLLDEAASVEVRDPLSDKLELLRPNGLARERCRPHMRNLLRIGHGASPDGRPEVCRQSTFLRLLRRREAGRMRTPLRGLRFRLGGVAVPAVLARRAVRLPRSSPGPTLRRFLGGPPPLWLLLYSQQRPRPPAAPPRPHAAAPEPKIPASIRAFDTRRAKLDAAR